MPQEEVETTNGMQRFEVRNDNSSDHISEYETSEENQTSERVSDSKGKMIGVLAGAALSQLPIWGFAMSYGVLQEYFTTNWPLQGSNGATGVIGTTSNGVMYLSMPILFAIFTRRWASRRQMAAFAGALLAGLGFLLSSFSTHAWQLIATQGVIAALGCALVYSPTTLSLGEWYSTTNRTVAYAVTLSCKNIVGSTCPFLFRLLLDRCGFRVTMRIWAGLAFATSIPSILLIPTQPSRLSMEGGRARKIPWHFLHHQTFYIYSVAIILQSCGYGIPQTYLNTYAHDVTMLSQTSATLMLTLFNIPGIVGSPFFGYLSQNKRFTLSVTTATAIPAVSSALAAFLFWGLTSRGSIALLILFSITFGFFAGGYSATWGGIINEFEREAAQKNEAIDLGMMYGLLNGARGVGYVVGGLVGVPLLKVKSSSLMDVYGYGTTYGPLIIFTGLSSVFGGWAMLWRAKSLLRFI